MDLFNPLVKNYYKNRFGGAGGGGSDTPSGKFKKKFMSVIRLKQANSSATYDHVATLTSALAMNFDSILADEEILPTKTYDGIKVSNENGMYFYFIEDENDLFVYGDVMGTGTEEWMSVSMMLGVEFGGVITDANQLYYRNQLAQATPYVVIYYVEAE